MFRRATEKELTAGVPVCVFACVLGGKSVPEPGSCFCQHQAGYQLLAGIQKQAERGTTSSIAGHSFKLLRTCCEISCFFAIVGTDCIGVRSVFGRGMPPKGR